MTEIQTLLAANVKAAREQKKFSQETLSELCGISRGFLGEVETSKKFPSARVLQRIADELGVKPFELFYDGSSLSRVDEKRLLREYSVALKERLSREVDRLADEQSNANLS